MKNCIIRNFSNELMIVSNPPWTFRRVLVLDHLAIFVLVVRTAFGNGGDINRPPKFKTTRKI